jgi:hypothetical protein
MPRDRVLECHFTAADNLEQERGESFGHRADLKTGVAIEASRVCAPEMPVRDHFSTLRRNQADDDADAIFLAGKGFYPLGEHRAKVGIRRDDERT